MSEETIQPVLSSAGIILIWDEEASALNVHWSDDLDEDTEATEANFVTSISLDHNPDELEIAELGKELLDNVASYASTLLQVADEEEKNPSPNLEYVAHNHVTRDVKSDGSCPACVEIQKFWSNE